MSDARGVEGAESGSAHGGESREHVVGPAVYMAVYAVLIALTVATTLVAYVNLGRFSGPVAVAIAIVKAALVALVFMHVRWSPRLVPVAALAAVLWLLQLFGGDADGLSVTRAAGVPGR
ncbi:MAG: cytochrome C oxidase subunit IV family protein [Polyangiaceae bacterium]